MMKHEVKTMSENTLQQILNRIEDMSQIHSQDIPSLDLYMDQILTLFDVNLADNKRYEDDKLLTKTMINNYSKEGLLKPIKGKKYSKEHILQMLLIYSLKNTISIQEIKRVLQPYHEKMEDIEPLYNQYLEYQKELSHQTSQSMTSFVDEHNFDLEDENQRTLLLLLLCSLSNQYKMIAEGLLDTYYPKEEKKK